MKSAVHSDFCRQLGRDLLFVLAAAVLSLPAGILINAVRRHPLPLVAKSPDERLMDELGLSPAPAGEMPRRVGLDEAIQAHDEAAAVFVDARDSAFFELGRIPGAINLPRSAFPAHYPSLEKEAGKTQPLIVYCSEADCADSRTVARALQRLGFSKVAIFEGGWREWEAAGLPTEQGMPNSSQE